MIIGMGPSDDRLPQGVCVWHHLRKDPTETDVSYTCRSAIRNSVSAAEDSVWVTESCPGNVPLNLDDHWRSNRGRDATSKNFLMTMNVEGAETCCRRAEVLLVTEVIQLIGLNQPSIKLYDKLISYNSLVNQWHPRNWRKYQNNPLN